MIAYDFIIWNGCLAKERNYKRKGGEGDSKTDFSARTCPILSLFLEYKICTNVTLSSYFHSLRTERKEKN